MAKLPAGPLGPGGDEAGEPEKDQADESVSKAPEKPADFSLLLRTADPLDWLLMFLGALGAACTGAVQPWCVVGCSKGARLLGALVLGKSSALPWTPTARGLCRGCGVRLAWDRLHARCSHL